MIVDEDKVISKAYSFATEAHQGQMRKYTGHPYITHPIEVSRLVSLVTTNRNIVAAALLHDTVEDTDVTLGDIQHEFGRYIYAWIESLTDISKPKDGTRAERKAIDRAHTALALPSAKTIKLADMIDNISSIVEYDPKFAVTYMAEKRALLEVLKEGNSNLFMHAKLLVDDYYNGR